MGIETRGLRPRAAAGGRPAVLLDALGTLLRFEPPAPRACAPRCAARGVEVDEAPRPRRPSARRSASTGAHLHEGRDAASLAALRRAQRGGDAAGARPPAAAALPRAGADRRAAGRARLRRLPRRAARARRAARRTAYALVVVSNWDVSLHERLAETGLRAAGRRRRGLGRARAWRSRSARIFEPRARARRRARGGVVARRRHAGGRRGGRAGRRAAAGARGAAPAREPAGRAAAARRGAAVARPGRSAGPARAGRGGRLVGLSQRCPRPRRPPTSIPGPRRARPELPEGVWRPEPPAPPPATAKGRRAAGRRTSRRLRAVPLWTPLAIMLAAFLGAGIVYAVIAGAAGNGRQRRRRPARRADRRDVLPGRAAHRRASLLALRLAGEAARTTLGLRRTPLVPALGLGGRGVRRVLAGQRDHPRCCSARPTSRRSWRTCARRRASSCWRATACSSASPRRSRRSCSSAASCSPAQRAGSG